MTLEVELVVVVVILLLLLLYVLLIIFIEGKALCIISFTLHINLRRWVVIVPFSRCANGGTHTFGEVS